MARATHVPGLITEFRGEVLKLSAGSNDGRKVRRLVRDLRKAKAKVKEAQAAAAALELQLKIAAGGHEVVQVGGGTEFSWRFVDSTTFSVREFKDDGYGDLYRKYLRTKQTRRFELPEA